MPKIIYCGSAHKDCVPSSPWIMEKKGVTCVEIVAIDNKLQIMAVLACALNGTFVQMIFQGKTEKCTYIIHMCLFRQTGKYHIQTITNH